MAVNDGRSVVTLNHDRAGPSAVVLRLTAACDPAGAVQAPLTKLAGLLQALPRNCAYGLKALIDQGGASGTAPATDAATPGED